MSWSNFFLLVNGVFGIYFGVVVFMEYLKNRRQSLDSDASGLTYDMGALVQEDAAPPEQVKMEDFKPKETQANNEEDQEVIFKKIHDEGIELEEYYARSDEFMKELNKKNVFEVAS